MAEYLAEQMRSLARRLDELTQQMPDTGLEGSLNAKQLAEILGIEDLALFTRSMNKIRAGKTDQLTRAEMTELAVAFVNLLAAEEKDTQKAMISLKRVSAKEEPMMEDASKDHISVTYTPNAPLAGLLDYKTVELKNAPAKVQELLQHYQDIRDMRDGKGVSGSPVPRKELIQQFAKDLIKAGYKDNARL